MLSQCRVSRRSPLSRQPRLRRCIGSVGAIAMMMACSPLVAFAQASPTPSQVIEEGLRRQQERDVQQQCAQQPQADVLSKPQPRFTRADLPTETPCFVIDDIALDGPGWERFRWLLNETAPYLHRCIGVQGLQRIASALDQVLIEQGYATTRVVLPAQNLREGRLKLFLHVGRVDAIRMVRTEAGKPVLDQRWLDIRALEQGVERRRPIIWPRRATPGRARHLRRSLRSLGQ